MRLESSRAQTRTFQKALHISAEGLFVKKKKIKKPRSKVPPPEKIIPDKKKEEEKYKGRKKVRWEKK